ncbi:MAG: ABC transporter ATP-binding protein [Anaerolineae bacterium]|nr:ABC transporter ATP-binding protein [Anaerolineae bacterium]
MSRYVIETHELGKQYRIGSLLRPKKTKEYLSDLIFEPFRRMRSTLVGGVPTNAEEIFWALRDVSFHVERGEAFGIIGVNGSGKSTLLKILANIVQPTEGYSITRGRIGTMLEVGAAINPEMTGRENIYLSGVILGMKTQDLDKRFDEIVDFAGIESFLETPLKRYSSGMRLRLAFSVAAHVEPEIMIIDEILAVGDLGFREKSLSKIRSLSTQGTTVLLVSHIPYFLKELCDTAMWLHDGRIRQMGRTDEISRNYQQFLRERDGITQNSRFFSEEGESFRDSNEDSSGKALVGSDKNISVTPR